LDTAKLRIRGPDSGLDDQALKEVEMSRNFCLQCKLCMRSSLQFEDFIEVFDYHFNDLFGMLH
jgi:hypothetical protein